MKTNKSLIVNLSSSKDKKEEVKKEEIKEEVLFSKTIELDGKKYTAYPYIKINEEEQNIQGWRAPYQLTIDKEPYIMDINPPDNSNLLSIDIDYAMTDIYTIRAKHDNKFKPLYRILKPCTFEPSKVDRENIFKFAEMLWKLKIYPNFNSENFATYNDELRVVMVENLIASGRDYSDFVPDNTDRASYRASALEYAKMRRIKSQKSLENALLRIGHRKTIDLENETIANKYYRRVIYSGLNSQLVLMNLPKNATIPQEVHEGDQFIRVEKGDITVNFVPDQTSNISSANIKDGQAIVIAAGQKHQIVANADTMLYTVYSFDKNKPVHPRGTIQATEEEAKKAERTEKAEMKGYTVRTGRNISAFEKAFMSQQQTEEDVGIDEGEQQLSDEEEGGYVSE